MDGVRTQDIAEYLEWLGEDNWRELPDLAGIDSTYGIYLLTLIASNQGPRVLRALNLDGWDSPDPFLNVYFHRGLYTASPAARFAQLFNELNKSDEGSGPSDITDSSGLNDIIKTGGITKGNRRPSDIPDSSGLNDINKAGGLTNIIEAGGITDSSGLTESSGLNDMIKTGGITDIIEAGGITDSSGLTDMIETGGSTQSSGLNDINKAGGTTEGNRRPSDNQFTLGLPGRYAVSEVFVKRTRNMDTFRNTPLHGTERPTITSDNVKDLCKLLYRCKGQDISTGAAGVNPLIISRRQQETNEQAVSLICLSLLTADPTLKHACPYIVALPGMRASASPKEDEQLIFNDTARKNSFFSFRGMNVYTIALEWEDETHILLPLSVTLLGSADHMEVKLERSLQGRDSHHFTRKIDGEK